MEDELLTVKDVATRLKVSTATVRRLLARGEIRGRKVGGRQWRIAPETLTRYIEGEPNAVVERMDRNVLSNRVSIKHPEIRSKKVAKMLESAVSPEGNPYGALKKRAKSEKLI